MNGEFRGGKIDLEALVHSETDPGNLLSDKTAATLGAQ